MLGWAGLRGAVPVVLATFPVIDGVPHSREFFNIVFFAVLVSTLLQGTTFEPLAQPLRRDDERARRCRGRSPRPARSGGSAPRWSSTRCGRTTRSSGARVRDLGLPRDALVNVIVRGEQAIPPRGSTRLEAGDRLHVLVRQEAAWPCPALLERWRAGPIGPPLRPRRPARAHAPIFRVAPWPADGGDPGRPDELGGETVVDVLRIRRDDPGALAVLEDGRYAITGPALAMGGRDDVIEWARRRLRGASDDERAWLQTVIGALAADMHDRRA